MGMCEDKIVKVFLGILGFLQEEVLQNNHVDNYKHLLTLMKNYPFKTPKLRLTSYWGFYPHEGEQIFADVNIIFFVIVVNSARFGLDLLIFDAI